MGEPLDDIEQAQEMGKLQSEVHTLNTLMTKVFKKVEDLAEKTTPKPPSIGGILGIATSFLAILTLLFGSTIYISNSSNAPMLAQMTQMAQTLNTINSLAVQTANHGQLLSKELSGVAKSVESNNNTLDWIIYQENLPKQITQSQGRLNTLEMQMERLINDIHNKRR